MTKSYEINDGHMLSQPEKSADSEQPKQDVELFKENAGPLSRQDQSSSKNFDMSDPFEDFPKSSEFTAGTSLYRENIQNDQPRAETSSNEQGQSEKCPQESRSLDSSFQMEDEVLNDLIVDACAGRISINEEFLALDNNEVFSSSNSDIAKVS